MTDKEPRFSPLTLVGDGLLLTAAIAGLTGSFLSLYGDAALGRYSYLHTTPLDQCAAWTGSFLTLAVVFSLLALVLWSLPRFQGAAAGALAALLGAVVFLRWDSVVQGAGLTVRTISVLFSQRVSWGWVLYYDPELTFVQQGAVTRQFLILSLVLLALILGWAVVRARRWWLVVTLTLPPLLPGLLADLYPNWPAFMALAACWCTMLLCDLCRWAAPDRRGKLTLLMLPCIAAALTVITLAFPREGYTRPQWALDMEVELNSGFNRLSDFFSRFDGPFGGRVTYVGAAEEADLTDAGPLRYTGRTVLRVEGDYDGRMYLRGSSLAVYENGRWSSLPEGVYEEYAPSDSVGTLAPFPLYFPVLTAAGGSSDAHTVTVDNVGAVGTCVYTPYHLMVQELEEGGMLPVEDSYLARRSGQWKHTVSFMERTPPDQTGPSADVDGVVVVFTTAAYAMFPQTNQNYNRYREFVYRHYLDVPEEYVEPLAGLYWERYGHRGSDPVFVAQRVADLLDELCEYDTEAPPAPSGADPVDYFLTESRRGYCMHYASAAALMLRSLGFPARYVSGFTAQVRPGQRTDVPDRAAHAWVEVWVDGFGWHPVEVTPAAAFAWEQSDPLASFELPSQPIEESEEPLPTPTPSQNPGEEASDQPSQNPQGDQEENPSEIGFDPAVLIPVARVLAAIAGVLALLWLGQYLPKRRRAKKLAAPDRNRAALDAYGYLLRMQRWEGRMDERVVELAQKARFSQHTLTREELDELRGFVDLERERLCIILDPLPRLLFRYLWGMPKRPKPEETRENTENDHENGA